MQEFYGDQVLPMIAADIDIWGIHPKKAREGGMNNSCSLEREACITVAV